MTNVLELILLGIIFGIVMRLAYAFYKQTPVGAIEERIKESNRVTFIDLLNSLDTVTSKAVNELKSMVDLSSTVDKLQKELAKVKNEKSSIEEGFARTQREIEHKLGLERARQSQELELATREAKLKAKEDNLQSERDLFKKEMDFRQNRFMEEVTYQRGLSEQLLSVIPGIIPQVTKIVTEHTENVGNK